MRKWRKWKGCGGDNGRRMWARRAGSLFLCAAFLMMTAACGGKAVPQGEAADQAVSDLSRKEQAAEADIVPADGDSAQTAQTAEDAAQSDPGDAPASPAERGSVGEFVRPALLVTDMVASSMSAQKSGVHARVPAYTIDADLGNVVNADRFWLQEKWKKQLVRDGFFVQDGGAGEFFEIYESNRYMQIPNFVTVDSLMHTYHLYFSYLLKNIERDALCDRLVRLTDRMLAASSRQRMEMMFSSQMTGLTADMHEAVERNIAFFAVAKALLDPSWDPASGVPATEGDYAFVISEDTLAVIREELTLIDAAAGIEVSPLSGEGAEFEDYSQYRPRGYYDTDEKLARYFRAMMWYGRQNFTQRNPSLDKSALLMTLAMDDEAFSDWSAIYAVTSFFAGASDDSGVCEYQPLIREAYGRSPEALNGLLIVSDEAGWERFHDLTAQLPPPAINSIPGWDEGTDADRQEENRGFRFMGQRFSLDAAVFQRLIYSAVGVNGQGEKRMLPDALDVPAALGSETALALLEEGQQVFGYQNYSKNMTELRKTIDTAPAALWTSSLYAGWLDTLRPLLADKGEGFPMFMRSENWRRKDLESFLGSYTELKHDTVLYSKQVMAEMGGGDEEILDDRGYVEPEEIVFDRFSALAHSTALGLKEFGLLSGEAERDLERLSEMARTLMVIAEKELANEVPTEEEFEFIRIYGGEIEHFWQEAYRSEAENPDYFTSREFPAALVVDVATDPNGSVLQLANDDPAMLMVVVPVDGTLRLARGSVYSFYEFAQPLSGRLTDREWRVLLGIDPDADGEYHWQREGLPDKPDWTLDYRAFYEEE